MKIISSLLIIIVAIYSVSAQASDRCFGDAQSAYAYLLERKQQQKALANRPNEGQAININTADEAELVQLKGIGSKKAQAIINYRQQMGNFSSVDDLTKVKGIGKKTVAKNRQYLQAY